MHEFDIIQTYFKRPAKHSYVDLSVGDDSALLSIPANHHLAISVDTMVEDQHFFSGTPPESLGHKILAVSLSDLAAMGALPIAFELSLTLPKADEAWLTAFSKGLFDLAKRYAVDLVGGDMTKGPLSMTSIVQGLVPTKQALTRSGAQIGDLIFVTGALGAPAYVVEAFKQSQPISAALWQTLYYPEPRVTLGLALRNMATACIDLSDGLAQDLQHVLSASEVGATLYTDQLPLHSLIANFEHAKQYALTGGDQYELCFTVPAHLVNQVKIVAELSKVKVTQVGQIEAGDALICLDENHQQIFFTQAGFQHF